MRILYDKDSGRSRGFGFVSFCKEDEAVSAKDAMDGKVSMDILALFSFFCVSGRSASEIESK